METGSRRISLIALLFLFITPLVPNPNCVGLVLVFDEILGLGSNRVELVVTSVYELFGSVVFVNVYRYSMNRFEVLSQIDGYKCYFQ